MQDNETILKQNKIIVQSDDDAVNKWFIKDELKTIPQQKANKRTLFIFPFKLWLYAASANKRENKFRWCMKNKVGEAPVIFDSTLVYPSKLLLENYYQNKGYFFTEVNTSIKTKRRRTTVTYNIKPNKAFKFRTVIFPYNTEVEQIAHDKMGGTLRREERITILLP